MNPPPHSTKSSVLNSKLSRYISLAPVRNGSVGHKRKRRCDFIAGLFPDLQACDLRTRHGATQPQTLLIDKHGNKASCDSLNATRML